MLLARDTDKTEDFTPLPLTYFKSTVFYFCVCTTCSTYNDYIWQCKSTSPAVSSVVTACLEESDIEGIILDKPLKNKTSYVGG